MFSVMMHLDHFQGVKVDVLPLFSHIGCSKFSLAVWFLARFSIFIPTKGNAPI